MSAIRALAEQLAVRSDEELRRLFALRPDLILPPVPDFPALAARSSTRVSLQRALDTVDRPHLQVLEALVVLEADDGVPVSGDRLAAALSPDGAVPVDVVAGLLEDLTHRALVTSRAGDGFLPVGALAEALGPYPAGLGRPFGVLARAIPGFGTALIRASALLGADADPDAAPVASAHLTAVSAARILEELLASPAAWRRILDAAPDGTAELLSRLRGAPVGTTGATATVFQTTTATDDTAGADAAGAGASAVVRWLLDRCLLAPLDALHVELPRSVGMAVRGHAVFEGLDHAPPAPEGPQTRASLRDNAAFSALAETLRLLTALLASVTANPVATLRTGGVGVREVRRLRNVIGVDEPEIVWLLELAAAVGLLVLDPDDSRWKVPRPELWEGLDRSAQWLLLVEGWLAVDRAPALVGSKLPDGAAINALAAEASRADAPMVRQQLLAAALELSGDQLSGAGTGVVATVAVLTEQDLLACAAWHQPRLHRRFARLVPGMLREAGQLGLTGGGALTDVGRLVAAGRLEEAARSIREALPQPVTRVVLQGDLTAVAPGYLQPVVTRGLLRMSTPEGQGPATTYRFSAASIRAALDAGEDAASILAFLREHSATEVPQALLYLVEDTASRYGSLRVGRAGSYLRTEDDAVVAAVLADPRASVLGLVQLAPTVIASPASPAELSALLTDLGFTPASDVVAGASGDTAGAGATRAGASTSPSGAGPADQVTGMATPGLPAHLRSRLNPWTLGEEEIGAQLEALRSRHSGAVDQAAVTASETLLGLETLRAAIRSRSRIRLATADREGNQVRQELVPLSVSGGRLRVFDPEQQVEKVVSVHRVMDVEILEGSAADG